MSLGTTSGGVLSLSAAKAVEIDGASTTELAANALSPTTLRAMIQAVDPAYYLGAKWYVNSAQFNSLTGTTDTTGQPLIRPNGPMILWGFPIEIAPEIPNLAASTNGGPIFGNLTRGMYYRDAGFEVIRTDQRFADALAVGWIGYQRCDFAARDARAFVTVKPAAT